MTKNTWLIAKNDQCSNNSWLSQKWLVKEYLIKSEGVCQRIFD